MPLTGSMSAAAASSARRGLMSSAMSTVPSIRTRRTVPTPASIPPSTPTPM
jgi:hypothetical protein